MCVYIYIYIYIHVCVYIYIYIYTDMSLSVLPLLWRGELPPGDGEVPGSLAARACEDSFTRSP